MSNRPSASLVYGVEFDPPEDFEELDNIIEKEKDITYAHFGMCDEDTSLILCIRNLGCDSYDWFNELGKTLPIALPEHDKMLKDFCDKNNIPFKEPQWFVLGYYG